MSNPAINLLRMFCACGDASNVVDDDQLNARRHYTTDMDCDEVSVYEEMGDAKNVGGTMSPRPTKVSKMMPSPISVFSYPFEDDSDSTEEEEDDDEDAYWHSLPYMSSAFAVSKDTPTLRLAPRTTTGHPLIGRSSSGTTATTIAMTTSTSGLSAAENFYLYPEVRQEDDELFDDMDFDIGSSLSTEIVQNPNPRRREYLDAVFRDTTNNNKMSISRRSSKSGTATQDQEESYKPQLIRMSQENYVHSSSIYSGDREKVLVQRGHSSTVQLSLIQH
jgi:hypothetical protein